MRSPDGVAILGDELHHLPEGSFYGLVGVGGEDGCEGMDEEDPDGVPGGLALGEGRVEQRRHVGFYGVLDVGRLDGLEYGVDFDAVVLEEPYVEKVRACLGAFWNRCRRIRPGGFARAFLVYWHVWRG